MQSVDPARSDWAYTSHGVGTAQDTVMRGALRWGSVCPGAPAELGADPNLHVGSSLPREFPWGRVP